MEPKGIADRRLPTAKANLSLESQSEVPADGTEDVREKEIPAVTYGHIAGFDVCASTS